MKHTRLKRTPFKRHPPKRKHVAPWRKHQPDNRAVRVLRDGREICRKTPAGNAEYRRRRESAWERDKGICVLCGQWLAKEIATAEHIIPRGMGGATRGFAVRYRYHVE